MFGELADCQKILCSTNIAELGNNVEARILLLSKKFHNKPKQKAILAQVLALYGQKELPSSMGPEKFSVAMKRRLEHFYAIMGSDLSCLVKELTKLKMTGLDVNAFDVKEGRSSKGLDRVIAKYQQFAITLLTGKNEMETRQNLFSFSGYLFNAIFCDPNNKHTVEMITTQPALYPAMRFFVAVMWHSLAENGWLFWHAQALQNLQHEAQQGKTVRYIAGGMDLYQLINNGIYTIHVIDPMVQSQKTYYTGAWKKLVKGEEKTVHRRGDIIDLGKGVYMERTSFKEYKNFTFKQANGKKFSAPKSKTVWTIYERRKKDKNTAKMQSTADKKLGEVLIDRRLCVQQDFITSSKEALLISCNELYFIAEKLWGIDPEKFSDDITMYVKQLSFPLKKQDILSMAATMDQFPPFIQLGTCVD